MLWQIDLGLFKFLNGLAESSVFLKNFFVAMGIYFIYLIPVVLILFWFYSPHAKKAALRVLVPGVAAIYIGEFLTTYFKRLRPVLNGSGQELAFHRPTYSFPSDHAMFLLAVTFSFWFFGYKRFAKVLFALSAIVLVARVAIGFHYPSDILSGGVVGFGIAWVFHKAEPVLKHLYDLVEEIAHKLKLSWTLKK